jgi:hypothetical protein
MRASAIGEGFKIAPREVRRVLPLKGDQVPRALFTKPALIYSSVVRAVQPLLAQAGYKALASGRTYQLNDMKADAIISDRLARKAPDGIRAS